MLIIQQIKTRYFYYWGATKTLHWRINGLKVNPAHNGSATPWGYIFDKPLRRVHPRDPHVCAYFYNAKFAAFSLAWSGWGYSSSLAPLICGRYLRKKSDRLADVDHCARLGIINPGTAAKIARAIGVSNAIRYAKNFRFYTPFTAITTSA